MAPAMRLAPPMPSSPLQRGSSGDGDSSGSSSTSSPPGTPRGRRARGRMAPGDAGGWYALPDAESMARAGGRRTSLVCPYDDAMHYEPRVDARGMSSAALVACEEIYSRDFAELAMTVRVMSNALEPATPLLDRFKFLAIVSSLLDEHFVQRLGAIEQSDPSDFVSFRMALRKSIRPRTPHDVKLDGAIRAVVRDQHAALTRDVLPSLRESGICILGIEELEADQRQAARSYFDRYVRHALTPLVVDQTHPFPEVSSHSIYMCVMLRPVSSSGSGSAGSGGAAGAAGWNSPRSPPASASNSSMGMVGPARRVFLKVPDGADRLVPLDAGGRKRISIERLIEMHIPEVCRGMHVLRVDMFRVTRNIKLELAEFSGGASSLGDTWADPQPDTDLWDAVQSETHRRRFAPPTRLETLRDFPADLRALLLKELALDESDVFVADGDLLDLASCLSLSFMDIPELRTTHKDPQVPPRFRGIADTLPTDPGKIFRVIKERDVLIEHPRDSFEGSTLLFLAAAARDPKVRSIKMVIYRAGSDSPLIKALERAAKNGKEVTVLVELKASFDEVLNCEYATRLQKAGCNVMYGVLGLKVHSKLMLAVRTEDDGLLATYCSIATGNFNHKTARIYTDCSIMTAREELCADMHDVFNSLSGLSHSRDFREALVAPYNMMDRFGQLVREEAENARAGRPARIVAQFNGLSDVQIIRELYDASQAGVKIDLIVRAACRLRPGLPGLSDNIRVFSWVGPVLQHRRIFYYYANGKEKTFIGSADWRTRNLNNRTEVAVPVYDEKIKRRLQKILVTMKDDRYLWQLFPDNRYYKISALPNSVDFKIAPPRQWAPVNGDALSYQPGQVPLTEHNLFMAQSRVRRSHGLDPGTGVTANAIGCVDGDMGPEVGVPAAELTDSVMSHMELRTATPSGTGIVGNNESVQSDTPAADGSYPDQSMLPPRYGKPQRLSGPPFTCLDESSADLTPAGGHPTSAALARPMSSSRPGSVGRGRSIGLDASMATRPAALGRAGGSRPRNRSRSKVKVTVKGNQISVDKIAVGAVPVKYDDAADISTLQVMVVQRCGVEDPWSVPKGGIKRSSEPHEEAAVRIAREKGGVSRAEHTGTLGWILRDKGNKSIAVSTFIVRVIDVGNFPATAHTRRRKWMPFPEAIALAETNSNGFTIDALKSAFALLRDEFEANAQAAEAAEDADDEDYEDQGPFSRDPSIELSLERETSLDGESGIMLDDELGLPLDSEGVEDDQVEVLVPVVLPVVEDMVDEAVKSIGDEDADEGAKQAAESDPSNPTEPVEDVEEGDVPVGPPSQPAPDVGSS